MTGPLPANISFGTVKGRFATATLTGGDADGFPDLTPATGLSITFTAATAAVMDKTASPAPVTIEMVPIVCQVDSSGYLIGGDGLRGVKLIATNDTDLDPNNWTWHVTFLRNGVKPAAFRDFDMTIDAGAEYDITLIAPIPSSTGVSLSAAQAAELAAVAAASAAAASAAAAAASTALFSVDNLPQAGVTGKVIAKTATEAAARTAIGATAVGSAVMVAATTAVAQTAIGATAAGSALITGADAAAQRTSLSAVGRGDLMVNVKDYGAIGNAQLKNTGSITSGTTALTCTSANFATTSVGNTIVINGAGVAGANLVTTIVTRTDATHVTIATAASTTVGATAQVIWGNNDTAAIAAAVTATVSGGILMFPPGTFINGGTGWYLTTATIVVPVNRKVMGGNSTGVTILGVTPGMTVMTLDTSCKAEDFRIHGAYSASWGLKTIDSVNRVQLSAVRVEFCTEHGIVMEGLQNSLLIDCQAQHNLGANMAFLNGCASVKVINCNTRTQSEGLIGTTQVLLTTSADARLTLPQNWSTGNREISFLGGIYENGNINPYQVIITGEVSGYISFTEVEMNGGQDAIVHWAPDTGLSGDVTLFLIRCQMACNGSSYAVLAESRTVIHDGLTYSGLSNNGVMSAIGSATIKPMDPNILTPASSLLQNGLGLWVATSSGTATFDAAKNRILVGSSSSTQGVKITFNTYWNYTAQYRMLRIRFNIRNITGATTVRLYALTAGGRYTIGDYAAGEFTAVYECVGDEVGLMFSPTTAVASTFELCSITCESN